MNYAATGMTVERMQIWKVTCDKSREYSTVTRDRHIFFGGNQQLVQYRVSPLPNALPNEVAKRHYVPKDIAKDTKRLLTKYNKGAKCIHQYYYEFYLINVK